VGFIGAIVKRAPDVPPGSTASITQALTAVLFLVSIGFMVGIGFVRGADGPNRFGECALRY
jgi:hypothetical protein